MVENRTYLICERGPHFWGTHQLAQETQYAKLEEDREIILPKEEFDDVLNSLKGKRVLIYIHGLRNTQNDVLESHNHLQVNITKLELKVSLFSRVKALLKSLMGYSQSEAYSNYRPYDAIIGYSWPSFDRELYYYSAKEHAKILAPKFAQELQKITSVAKKTDVMAHSMGNLLLFEALSKHTDQGSKIDHLYSVAAAVPHDCFSPNSIYSKVLEFTRSLFVFHSSSDFALGWPYYYAERSTFALGLCGPTNTLCYPKNLKVVDASKVINGHSDYLSSEKFYDYLLKIHNQEIDLESQFLNMDTSL